MPCAGITARTFSGTALHDSSELSASWHRVWRTSSRRYLLRPMLLAIERSCSGSGNNVEPPRVLIAPDIKGFCGDCLLQQVTFVIVIGYVAEPPANVLTQPPDDPLVFRHRVFFPSVASGMPQCAGRPPELLPAWDHHLVPRLSVPAVEHSCVLPDRGLRLPWQKAPSREHRKLARNRTRIRNKVRGLICMCFAIASDAGNQIRSILQACLYEVSA